jgi:hypothetical protein
MRKREKSNRQLIKQQQFTDVGCLSRTNNVSKLSTLMLLVFSHLWSVNNFVYKMVH